MDYTPINELPAPPAFMLEEAEEAETQYIQDLAQQVMTIKEARVVLLPIIAQANESPANKVFREALEDYTRKVLEYSAPHLRSGMIRNGSTWNISRFFLGKIYHNGNYKHLTTKRYSTLQMRLNVTALERRQLEKFCRTKSGKVPAYRIRRAYDLKREVWKHEKIVGRVIENGDWLPYWEYRGQGTIARQKRYFKPPSFWVLMEDFKKNRYRETYIYDWSWCHLMTEVGRDLRY